MKNLAILITCFNRIEKTLACLNYLYKNILPADHAFEIFLVDDGSTDETTEIIIKKYPDINIISGTGSLYWAGGMRLAWKTASNKNFDYYIWLNNDVILFENSIETLIYSSTKLHDRAIICSTMIADDKKTITYGGKKLGERHHIKPDGSMHECQIINGNCVLVPNIIFKTIGNLDIKFQHAIADHDYSLRAIKAGFKCYVAPKIIGICNANPLPPKWCLKEYSLSERIKSLYSPLGNADPFVYFHYVKRHFGLYQAVKQFVSTHIRVIMPQLWK